MLVRQLVAPVAGPALGVFGLGAAWLAGPWSPLAMDAANARYVAGDLAGAVSAYEAVGEGWHTPGTRADAWRRAARIRRTRGDARGAVRALEHATTLAPSSTLRAEIFDELASLYLDRLHEPRAAAEAFEAAAVEGGGGHDDLLAAAAWQSAGETARAEDALTRAAADPATWEEAELALATLQLHAGAMDGAE